MMLTLGASCMRAQEVRVYGTFVADSLKIGVPTPFVLTARYPQSATVLFPDTTFQFTPFEFSRRTYFPTHTANGESVDSVVYELTSFEIDSIQYLQLPVFLVNAQDCTVWQSPRDSIFLEHLVAHVPDSTQAASLPMKINTSYQFVNKLLNYPVALLIVGIIGVLAGVVALVFGKRIRKYFVQRKLTRQHALFLSRFQQQVEKMEGSFSSDTAESCLVIWKSYMEQLLQFPITKLTSREIVQRLPDTQLQPSLSEIDRMIYAGMREGSRTPFYALKAESQKAFERKLEEVKYG
jgi:hypothetical protein